MSLLADGYTAEGFEALNKMGWIREIEDEGDRYRAIAHEFADIIDRKEEVLATCRTGSSATGFASGCLPGACFS